MSTNKAPASIVIQQNGKLGGDIFCRQIFNGMQQAAERFGGTPRMGGPSALLSEEQVKNIEEYIDLGVSAIIVAPNDPPVVTPALEKARAAGIKCLDYDSHAEDHAVDYHCDQFDTQEYGRMMVEMMVNGLPEEGIEGMGDSGEWLLVTRDLLNANLSEWCKASMDYAAEKYPNLKLNGGGPHPTSIVTKNSRPITAELLKKYPNTKGIIAYSGNVSPGVAQAIDDAGLTGKITFIGCTFPNSAKEHLEKGSMTVGSFFSTEMLGYFAYWVALQDVLGNPIVDGQIVEGLPDPIRVIPAKNPGEAATVIMAKPLVFTKNTVHQYDF